MTSTAPPRTPQVAEILHGPSRVGTELRWTVELTDGTRGLLARLVPELARDEAVRRRYLNDLERRASIHHPGVAELLTRGDDDVSPWRLRAEPNGASLAEWLEAHAPAQIAEVIALGSALADILHGLHGHGMVVRDLHPRLVVMTPTGPVLTDIGLARVDLLSTRTAASLVLEGSPYASPEQLRKTVLDARSDLFGLGVILWKALTASLPYGSRIALFADERESPRLAELRDDVPEALAHCVERCIALDPEARPAGASEVALALRGQAAIARVEPHATCQSCGATLPRDLRLCTRCGKQAVVFEHAPANAPQTCTLVLKKVNEDADALAALRATLAAVSAGPVPALNFIVGDARMYSKQEQASRLKLPLVLFADLAPETAERLAERLTARGIAVAVRKPRRVPRAGVIAGVAVTGVIAAIAATGASSSVLLIVAAIGLVAVLLAATISHTIRTRRPREPLLRLRSGPAALPASDPLVARLAALIDEQTPSDVRERIGELALAVQRAVDHRQTLADRADQRELQLLLEPIDPLVELIETQTRRLQQLDRDLDELDEGALVRGLAAARARDATASEQEALLTALDRLRTLEDLRAAALHRLLEAASLLRRAVDLGLEVGDAKARFEDNLAAARAALEG